MPARDRRASNSDPTHALSFEAPSLVGEPQRGGAFAAELSRSWFEQEQHCRARSARLSFWTNCWVFLDKCENCVAHNGCCWARTHAQPAALGPTVAVEGHSFLHLRRQQWRARCAWAALRGCNERAQPQRFGGRERSADAAAQAGMLRSCGRLGASNRGGRRDVRTVPACCEASLPCRLVAFPFLSPFLRVVGRVCAPLAFSRLPRGAAIVKPFFP